MVVYTIYFLGVAKVLGMDALEPKLNKFIFKDKKGIGTLPGVKLIEFYQLQIIPVSCKRLKYELPIRDEQKWRWYLNL